MARRHREPDRLGMAGQHLVRTGDQLALRTGHTDGRLAAVVLESQHPFIDVGLRDMSRQIRILLGVPVLPVHSSNESRSQALTAIAATVPGRCCTV